MRFVLALCLLWSATAGAVTKPAYVAGQVVNKNLGISQGLVAAYLLNEGSGTVVHDSSGSALGGVGAFSGSPNPTWITGMYGPAITSLGGSNATEVNVTNSNAGFSWPMTFAIGLVPTASSAFAMTFGGTATRLYWSASGTVATWNPVGYSATPSATNVAGQPVIIVGTADVSGNATLSANGGTVSSAAWGLVPTLSQFGGVDMAFGGGWAYGVGFFSTVNFVYVWNRVLSPAEIALLNANPFAMYGGCACTRIIRQTPRYITQQQCCDEAN